MPASTRRKDKDRRSHAGFAPAAQQREPVHRRQAEVEHHGVVPLGRAEELCALAVTGAVHRIARLTECGGQLACQRRFVFHYEHPQASFIAQVTLNGA